MGCRIFFLLLSILFGLACSGCAITSSADAGPVCSLRPVDRQARGTFALFFATNRQAGALDGGYGIERSDAIGYGRLEIAMPATRSFGSIEGYRIARTQLFANADAFSQALDAESGSRAASKPRLVFVHGYAESFERAAFRNAEVLADGCLDVVPVLFSWPSRDAFASYNYDRESATFSRDALAGLIRRVAGAGRRAPTHVMAHSMGNWIALEALAMLREHRGGNGAPPIGALVLASPDVDVDVFRKALAAVAGMARSTLLLTSHRDLLLQLSSTLASGVPRAGSADARELEAHGVTAAGNFSIVHIDESTQGDCQATNHQCAENNPAVLRAIRQAMERAAAGRMADRGR